MLHALLMVIYIFWLQQGHQKIPRIQSCKVYYQTNSARLVEEDVLFSVFTFWLLTWDTLGRWFSEKLSGWSSYDVGEGKLAPVFKYIYIYVLIEIEMGILLKIRLGYCETKQLKTLAWAIKTAMRFKSNMCREGRSVLLDEYYNMFHAATHRLGGVS